MARSMWNVKVLVNIQSPVPIAQIFHTSYVACTPESVVSSYNSEDGVQHLTVWKALKVCEIAIGIGPCRSTS